MAGDWIKMRGNLWDDPRIARMAETTRSQEATVIGGLYWLWATADQHTADGLLVGLSLSTIDRKTAIKGFGAALAAVGWIAEEPDGIRITRFEEHNGITAKSRSLDAKRKAGIRKNIHDDPDKCPPDVPDMSGCEPDKSRTETGSDPELEKEKEKERAEASPRGSRLPLDWRPDPDLAAWSQAERPDLDIEFTLGKFRDHWAAKPGKDGRKLDWSATWRNWVRAEQGGKRVNGSSASKPWEH